MDNLQLSYEMGGSGNYLSASLAEEINTYQLKMIENNKIAGILPIHSLVMNGVYKLQYDITGKSRLNDFLNSKNCTGESARKILYSFVYTLVHAEDYLLTYKQFLLEKEYIYLNSNGEVYFVYLPLGKKVVTAPEEIQSFIRNLLVEHFTADGDAFFLGLLRYVSMYEYSLVGLLEKLEEGQQKKPEDAMKKESVRDSIISESIVTGKDESGFAEAKAIKEKSIAEVQTNESLLKSKKESESKDKNRNGEIKNPAAFDFAIPGLPATPPSMKSKEESVKEKQKEKKSSFFDSLRGGGKSKDKTVKKEVYIGKEVATEKQGNIKAEKEEAWVGTQIGFGVQENKGTITMGDMTAAVFACIRHNGKKVPLDHFPFYVGRDEGDYRIPRPRVSGKHLYFTEQEGRFFVVDDNSTNHTYVNGQRIAPYTATEIESGDTIRLADEEVVFLLEN